MKNISSQVKLLIVFAVYLFINITCQRELEPLNQSDEAVIKDAKEWWYGTFVKSSTYTAINKSSPFAAPEGYSEKKYPRWKRAVTYEKNGMTVVELPLAYEATRVLLPYMNDIATTEEYNRIAKAVVHKILIFNMPGGEKLVRTVSLIPSRQYAKKHYYDLSNITFKALPKDFNGYQMVMKWDQTQISTTLIENGKEAKKLILGKYTKSELQTRMKAKNWTMSADGKSLQPRVATVMSAPGTLSSIPGVDCGGSIYVPNYVWVCITFDSGDDIADQEDCERTGHWVDDGNGTWIDLPQCADPEPPNPCDTWNLGCDDGGGGGGTGSGPPPVTWSPDIVLFSKSPAGEKVLSISDYLKCFSFEMNASVTLYIDQPVVNSTATWSGSITDPNVGHTFISITQGNITRYIGFYPSTGINPYSSDPSSQRSIIKDENHSYDVSLTMNNVSGNKLMNLINFIQTSPGTYNLNDYNCTDFAVDCMYQVGISLYSSQGTWPGGGGDNPGNLGQDVRNLQITNFPNISKNTTGGTSGSNSGNCN